MRIKGPRSFLRKANPFGHELELKVVGSLFPSFSQRYVLLWLQIPRGGNSCIMNSAGAFLELFVGVGSQLRG